MPELKSVESGVVASDMRLLRGLREALGAVAGMDDAAARNYALVSAHALLDELMLRTDSAWYSQYLERGAELLRELGASTQEGGDIPRSRIADTLSRIDPSAGAGLAFDVAAPHIEAIRQCLADVTPALVTRGSPGDSELLAKLLAWEADIYTRAVSFNSPPAETAAVPTLDTLEDYLRKRFPQLSDLRVTGFQALNGGLQKLTILFETSQPVCGVQSLVLRAEQSDRFLALDLGGIVDEFAIVQLVFEAGIPAAEPLWCEADPGALGRRFLVSRRVEGINYGSAVGVDDMPDEVARAFVELLVKLHSFPVRQHHEGLLRTPLARWLKCESLAANTLENVFYWRRMLDGFTHSASPALEAICAWLVANVPPTEAPVCLLHCDYGPHNALVEGHRISALLDWESARIGDPAEDLAFFLERTAGKVDRDEAIGWYEQAGGQQIDEFRLRYFELFSLLKVFVACLGSNALYAKDPGARNEMVPLAFQLMHWPVGVAAERIEAANRARRARS